MSTGRRASDWLRDDTATPGGDERRADRRESDRRAPRRRIDALFAATLINQVKPAAETIVQPYGAAPNAPRRGLKLNMRA